mmetsp:Transcript_90498/g.110781  ORF Transcript_90498/g.110781 Transcript_90498/m.110781 type:complete len:201 (+) Transcript_90498:127-729(+)
MSNKFNLHRRIDVEGEVVLPGVIRPPGNAVHRPVSILESKGENVGIFRSHLALAPEVGTPKATARLHYGVNIVYGEGMELVLQGQARFDGSIRRWQGSAAAKEAHGDGVVLAARNQAIGEIAEGTVAQSQILVLQSQQVGFSKEIRGPFGGRLRGPSGAGGVQGKTRGVESLCGLARATAMIHTTRDVLAAVPAVRPADA